MDYVTSSVFAFFFFFSSRRRHTRWNCDWSSDVCSSDLAHLARQALERAAAIPVETVAQEQVFRRVTAQRELRSQDEVRSGGARILAIPQDLGGVAREIADNAVDLGNRDLDDARHRASLP